MSWRNSCLEELAIIGEIQIIDEDGIYIRFNGKILTFNATSHSLYPWLTHLFNFSCRWLSWLTMLKSLVRAGFFCTTKSSTTSIAAILFRIWWWWFNGTTPILAQTTTNNASMSDHNILNLGDPQNMTIPLDFWVRFNTANLDVFCLLLFLFLPLL